MIKNLKAIAADIDMTLTAKGADLPEITKKAFDVLHENGILIGLATGVNWIRGCIPRGKNGVFPIRSIF